MDETKIITVEANIETICCDGGKDGLGHPAVYYAFNKENKIVCNYCGKEYLRNKNTEQGLSNV